MKISEIDPETLAREVWAAPSLAAVAERYGCSRERVSQLCLRHKIHHGKRAPVPAKKAISLPKWVLDVVSASDLCQLMGWRSKNSAWFQKRRLALGRRPLCERIMRRAVIALGRRGLTAQQIVDTLCGIRGASLGNVGCILATARRSGFLPAVTRGRVAPALTPGGICK